MRRLLFLLLVLMLGVRLVSAHGYVLRSIPADRAVLEQAPSRVQLWFSEALESRFTHITILNSAGEPIATGGVPEENPALLSARLPRNLPDGVYVVDMRIAFSSDGHVVAVRQTFTIGAGAAGDNTRTLSDTPDSFEMLWRSLSYATALGLFGVFAVYAVILVPAWGSPTYRAGWLPPRVINRAAWLAGAMLALLLVGQLLALAQQTMIFFDVPFAQVLSGSLWEIVRGGTRFGDMWTARAALWAIITALFIASLYVRNQQPEWLRPFWTAALWPGALLLGTFSASSHAVGWRTWPWWALGADWLHLLALGFWLGGLFALTLLLPTALAPLDLPRRATVSGAALRRFSRLATVCVVIVVATGIYSAVNPLTTPADLTGTRYGITLLVKLGLVGAVLALGWLHHRQFTAPATASPSKDEGGASPRPYARLQSSSAKVGILPTLRLETGLALMVILCAGALAATPPPVPNVPAAPPPLDQTQMVDGLTVAVTLTPGGAGVNTYDVTLTQDGQALTGWTIALQFAQPKRDNRSGWLPAEEIADGAYAAAGGEITQTGQWWTLVNLTAPNGGITTRAAFAWDVDQVDPLNQAQPPSLALNLALLGVLGACSWVVYPFALGVYRRLDLRPVIVGAAVGATVLAVVMIAFAVAWMNDTQARYDAALNPAPQVINPTLPDAESLARGADLLAVCGWQTRSAWESLRERLPRLRDETLFKATRSGWESSLSACPLGWTDAQRWDFVNALRAAP